MSPTLTMGLGIAVCIGPVQAAACYAFSLPIREMLKDFCDWIEARIQDVLNKAAEFVNKVTDKIGEVASVATMGLITTKQDDPQPGTFEHSGSLGGSDSPLILQDNINIKIPGFPSVFTDWLDAQFLAACGAG